MTASSNPARKRTVSAPECVRKRRWSGISICQPCRTNPPGRVYRAGFDHPKVLSQRLPFQTSIGRPAWHKIDRMTESPRGARFPGRIAVSHVFAGEGVHGGGGRTGTEERPESTQTPASRASESKADMPRCPTDRGSGHPPRLRRARGDKDRLRRRGKAPRHQRQLRAPLRRRDCPRDPF